MNQRTNYLYDNTRPNADIRLKGLEAIEDGNTISLIENMTSLEGHVCLEIGAGTGSIAKWLATRVGSSGAVTATDIEPKHLDGTNYEIRPHDIQKDDLPKDQYDFVHFRHLLIHLTEPAKALKNMRATMKTGAFLLAEESDLRTWVPDEVTPSDTRTVFERGVDAVFDVYRSRGMDIGMGASLMAMLTDVGFSVTDQSEFRRKVVGGSPEAVYQGMSAKQLAESCPRDSKLVGPIMNLARCLLDPELRYQSRTTVSVSVQR